MKHNSSISSFKAFALKYGVPYLLIIFTVTAGINLFFKKVIVGSTTGSGAYKVERILHKNMTNETPIYGSSRAEGSFVPDSLGPHYFNYGIANVQDNVWIYFLEKELQKSRKTNILINFDLEGLDYRNGFPFYWMFNASSDTTIRSFIGPDWKMMYYIPTFRHISFYEKYLVHYLQEKNNLTAIINKGAILEKKELTPEEFKMLAVKREKDTVIFKNDQVLNSKLKSLLANTGGRKIFFIIPPYHPSYIKSVHNLPDALRYLDTLSMFPNVKVMNYSTMPLAQEYFYNTTHLNYKGAILFSKQLKQDLALAQ
jgi:hypothetical protein